MKDFNQLLRQEFNFSSYFHSTLRLDTDSVLLTKPVQKLVANHFAFTHSLSKRLHDNPDFYLSGH